MLTRCPRCKTSFRVLAQHLKVAHGRVQCGRCYIQFDALETLFDEEGPDAIPRLEESPAPDAEVVAGDAVANIEDAPVAAAPTSSALSPIADVPDVSEAPEVEVPEVEVQEPPDDGFSFRLDTSAGVEMPEEKREIPIGDLDAIEAGADEAATESGRRRDAAPPREIAVDDDVLLQDFGEPVIAREHVDEELIAAQAQPVADSRGHPLWAIAAGLLLLLGATQYGWYQRENLVERMPALRPAIEAVCARLGCELKPQRDLDAIKVLARDVRDHPRFKDSLLVNATLENGAAFTQPYPVLELTLYDAAGTRIGVRRFQPDEYLDSSVPVKQGMKPQQPVYIVLEIARPVEDAVSFEFKFY